MAQDRFKDWNLYHKSVAVFVGGLFALVIMLLAYAFTDWGFEVSHKRVVHYDAASVWPFVVEDKNRSRWIAAVRDVAPLTGKAGTVGASRFLIWRQDGKQWTAFETVDQNVPERKLVAFQQSDLYERVWTVELEPVAPCGTAISLKEWIRPRLFQDRFWIFTLLAPSKKRLSTSLDSLDYWLEESASP